MEPVIKTKKLLIGGMTCISCQNRIEESLRHTAGIQKAEISYQKGIALIAYDSEIISLESITGIIEGLGYQVLSSRQQERGKSAARIAGILLLLFALYILFQNLGLTGLFSDFPLAEAGMGYGMLLVIGLITSLHCLTMCGGINLSQCLPAGEGGSTAAVRSSLLYNLGRVISYTVIGGAVGALGSAISFSGAMKGAVQLIAGVFMVIMGLNMLGLFPWLRRLTPRMPKIFARRIDDQKRNSNSPLYVGLLNGLMPCGPLQAMQIYALSTGDPLQGALSMLMFSLGTLPLMFGLGVAGTLLSRKFTRRVMVVGAVLVTVMGMSMFTSGWSLSGFSPGIGATRSVNQGEAAVEDGMQAIRSTLEPGRYPAITVRAGLPVKWTIDAPEGSVNGCNNRIFIPEYDIEYQFKTGENVIEFTPDRSGVFSYSCWMGMISASITVTDEGGKLPEDPAGFPDTWESGDAAAGDATDPGVSAPDGCCAS